MTSYRDRVEKATNDDDWQRFRASLKGTVTSEKLEALQDYYDFRVHVGHKAKSGVDLGGCDICVRLDNYLKALARGGQLTAPMSLVVALDHNWDLQIRK